MARVSCVQRCLQEPGWWRHLRVPPLLLGCARARSHACALAALTRSHAPAGTRAHTWPGRTTLPHTRSRTATTQRGCPPWRPEHPRASQSWKEGLPFLKHPKDGPRPTPPPWRGLSYPRPGAPALAWPVCGQSPGCLSTLQCVTGARASPREELSARVPSGQSGPPRIPLTALRWVPRQPLREGLGLTLTLCSVETLRGRPARGGGRRQEEEAGTGDHGPRSDGGPCWAQG